MAPTERHMDTICPDTSMAPCAACGTSSTVSTPGLSSCQLLSVTAPWPACCSRALSTQCMSASALGALPCQPAVSCPGSPTPQVLTPNHTTFGRCWVGTAPDYQGLMRLLHLAKQGWNCLGNHQGAPGAELVHSITILHSHTVTERVEGHPAGCTCARPAAVE
jgi:hypothetical protein